MAAFLSASMSGLVSYGIIQIIYSQHERQIRELQMDYIEKLKPLVDTLFRLHGKEPVSVTSAILKPGVQWNDPLLLVKEKLQCKCQENVEEKIDDCEVTKQVITNHYIDCLDKKNRQDEEFKKNEWLYQSLTFVGTVALSLLWMPNSARSSLSQTAGYISVSLVSAVLGESLGQSSYTN